MIFKTKYAKAAGVKDTKTEVTLDTGDLSLYEWCKYNMTIEKLDHCLWYGVALEDLKAELKGIESDVDVTAKAKRLWSDAVTVRFNVPVAAGDQVAKLVKQDSKAVEEAILASGLYVKDAQGKLIRVKK